MATKKSDKKKPKFWIKEATENKGGLHKSLGVPKDETIPPGEINKAATKKGKVGAQARAAKTLAKLRKRKK